MESIQLKTRVGADGILKLEIPLETAEADLDVLVVVQPMPSEVETRSTEDLGWPGDFFERVAGGWEGTPLQRPEQGEFEIRDELQ